MISNIIHTDYNHRQLSTEVWCKSKDSVKYHNKTRHNCMANKDHKRSMWICNKETL